MKPLTIAQADHHHETEDRILRAMHPQAASVGREKLGKIRDGLMPVLSKEESYVRAEIAQSITLYCLHVVVFGSVPGNSGVLGKLMRSLSQEDQEIVGRMGQATSRFLHLQAEEGAALVGKDMISGETVRFLSAMGDVEPDCYVFGLFYSAGDFLSAFGELQRVRNDEAEIFLSLLKERAQGAPLEEFLKENYPLARACVALIDERKIRAEQQGRIDAIYDSKVNPGKLRHKMKYHPDVFVVQESGVINIRYPEGQRGDVDDETYICGAAIAGRAFHLIAYSREDIDAGRARVEAVLSEVLSFSREEVIPTDELVARHRDATAQDLEFRSDRSQIGGAFAEMGDDEAVAGIAGMIARTMDIHRMDAFDGLNMREAVTQMPGRVEDHLLSLKPVWLGTCGYAFWEKHMTGLLERIGAPELMRRRVLQDEGLDGSNPRSI